MYSSCFCEIYWKDAGYFTIFVTTAMPTVHINNINDQKLFVFTKSHLGSICSIPASTETGNFPVSNTDTENINSSTTLQV